MIAGFIFGIKIFTKNNSRYLFRYLNITDLAGIYFGILTLPKIIAGIYFGILTLPKIIAQSCQPLKAEISIQNAKNS